MITINGQIGCAVEVGQEVAARLGFDYVDRVILAQSAERLGSSVPALEEKERERQTLRGRLAALFDTALRRAAYVDLGETPFFGPYVDALLSRPYPEGEAPELRGAPLDDQRFFDVLRHVIEDLADQGNTVIVGRGSNLILGDRPGVLHVRTVASLEFRIETIMKREGLDLPRAEKFVADEEEARIAFFHRFFGKHPDDPLLYHIVVNLGLLGVRGAADVIASAV